MVLEKHAIDIIDDLLEDSTFVINFKKTKRLDYEKPKLKKHLLSKIQSDNLNKIDLLNITVEEKKEPIKNIMSLGEEERSKLIDEILKRGTVNNT